MWVENQFFALPDDVWKFLLTEGYLILRDICVFDSALTEHARRPWFLQLLKECLFLREKPLEPGRIFDLRLTSIYGPLPGFGAMIWLGKRGMHLATLFLPQCLDDVSHAMSHAESCRVRFALSRLIEGGLLDRLEIVDLNRARFQLFLLRPILLACASTVRRVDVRIEATEMSSILEENMTETYQSIVQCLSTCRKLDAFASSGFESDRTMAAMTSGNPGLRVLVMRGLPPAIAEAIPISSITLSNKLEHIVLQGYYGHEAEATTRLLLGSNKSLVYVDISGLTTSDETVRTLCLANRGITNLNLDKCLLLTNESMRIIATCLPGLTSISMCSNNSITKAGIKMLIQGCHDIKCIGISHCIQLGNRTLFLIANVCTELEFIDISGCFDVRYEGLARLAEKCGKLKKVSFSSVSRLWGGMLQSPEVHFPRIMWDIWGHKRPPHPLSLLGG